MFEHVQHAAQLSPLKQHTDAQHHPRGPTHIPSCLFSAHRPKDRHTHTDTETKTAKHADTLLICIPASASLFPLKKKKKGLKKVSFLLSVNKYQAVFLHKDHLSSLSLALSLLHSSLPLSSLASCNSVRWLPVDCWELVVLRS